MVKFVPKEIKENVNVSHNHPLKEMAKLATGILAVVLVIYILLGFAAALIAPHVSADVEIAMGKIFKKQFTLYNMHDETVKLQKIMDRFKPFLSKEDRRLDYKVFATLDERVNALALPGGTMVVFSGLLNKVKTDNEIAFVLAHELGHFHNRDHLKVMGRALVGITLSIAIFGDGSSAAKLISNAVFQVEMKFSQGQERAADSFAVNLMKKAFGNADGAMAFMKKLAEENSGWEVLYYFSSHPHPKERLK
ncbi:MAG: M48 family metallopeptidase, partial [bacterium]|nr:M48 family metallopeptidase [bacterium]